MFQDGWRGIALLNVLGIVFGHRLIALPVTALALTAIAVGGELGSARAQDGSQDFHIDIASVVQIATSTENPLRIEITPQEEVPDRSLLLIRGLPQSVALSQGRLFESGVWAVPVAALDDLRMTSSSGTVPKADFSVSLVTIAGDVLAETNSMLVVAGPGQALQATAAVQQADEIPSGSDVNEPTLKLLPPPPSPEALERVMLLMQKGEAGMKAGNVTIARAFFTQAAEQGWADGALALGATYDPDELANLRTLGGIQPDPAMAKRWYETAAKLGSRVAETRLQRLSQR